MAPVQNGTVRSVSVATLRWHLTLLGFAGIALSIASGWTTWDGMANFTHNPVLSVLITFGIQSVMLISAWMIGETFAEQAMAKDARRSSVGGRKRFAGSSADAGQQPPVYSDTRAMFVWVALLAIGIVFLSQPVSAHITSVPLRYGIAITALIAGAMLLRRAFHALGFGDLILPYEKSATAIFKNVPLWAMFLVCLTASVFFSFDSLFDRIYSSTDRETVSRSRLQSHVSGLLSDLHVELEDSRRSRIAVLFESPVWQTFETELEAISAAVDEVRVQVETRRSDHATARSAQIGNEVAQITAARAEMDSIDGRLKRANEEFERSEQDLAAARSNEQKTDLLLTAQRFQMDRKARAAALEAAGNGITQLVGKGQKYRQLKAEEAALRLAVDQSAADLAAARGLRHTLTEEHRAKADSVAQLQSARSEIASRIARAQWHIDNAGKQGRSGVDVLEDLSPDLVALNAARSRFLNQPDRQTYATLNGQCAGVVDSLRSVGDQNGAARSFKCGTMAGSGALVNVFNANAALTGFEGVCGKTIKLTGLTADEFFEVGQSCIQLSGLNSAITAGFLSDLRQVALRRDDRAHRFVVTWNAFFDSNPLAFVALFIALSIDGLVFVSGLFGANAEVSLRISPGRKASRKTAVADSRGDAVLDFALLPDVPGTARLLLDCLVPAPLGHKSGSAGEIDLSDMTAQKAERIRTVLNTACALHMAEKLDGSDRYVVKTGLIDHLSVRLGWQRGVSAGTWVESNPEEMLSVALGPQRRHITQCILQHAQPLPAETGFAYALDVADCPGQMQPQITGVLNTAVAGGTVSGDPVGDRIYLLTAAFIAMITRLAASEPYSAAILEASAAPENVSAKPLTESDRNSAAGSADQFGAAETDGRSAADPACKPARLSSTMTEGWSEKRGIAPVLPYGGAGSPPADPRPSETAHVPDDPPVETALSSKLITFPIDSKLRQQTDAGRNQRTAQIDSGDSPTTATDRNLAHIANNQDLEKAISDLVAGTDIARQEVMDWLRTDSGPEYDDAWSFLGRVCNLDGDFGKKLDKHEQTARRKIDQFGESLQAANWDSGGVRIGPVLKGQSEQLHRIYRPYLLRRYGVKEAMAWCVGALTELEANAVIDMDSASRRSQLQLIEDVIARLSPLDAAHRHEWNEIGLRVDGLGRQHAEIEAFGDLMP